MEVEELLSKAWAAVEKAGIPDELHELAFREAISFLRVTAAPSPAEADSSATVGAAAAPATPTGAAASEDSEEDVFFRELASESGESESDLRDILSMGADGNVHVTVPTKALGTSTSEQARNAIALIAGARAKGKGEKPVNAEAVRTELKRKQCFDRSNFAAHHLGRLKGFNAGASQAEIVLTSKWVEEFKAALAKAHGRKLESGS